ncbi:MAG: bifunctional folylpolyglutamate synthase/dihydrofolate synthase [Candidatus Aenigmarchaeota archaeon]|nr:bifunctional folylpolyglutamate synthase/dihydrofolate synthase [Candidatus Aenigmarchaeota archaeon]
MNYEESKDYIMHLNKFGMKLGLDRVEKILSYIDNPEKKFRSILVGGTCGKGSTVTMISSILRETGLIVGTFVKPHLFDFRERISVNGEMISETDFVRLVEKVKPFTEMVGKDFEKPTFFEFTTAVAFDYFAEKNVDIAVVEVGLGGRLDATNVLNPDVSVITNVSLEHTDILGDTVEKIAVEKGGIIKQNGTLVVYSDNIKVIDVVTKLCNSKNAKLITALELSNPVSIPKSNSFDFENTRINVPLGGKYQLNNIACALSAVLSMPEKIPTSAIKQGLENVKWPGRFEIVSDNPTIILDGAKDPTSMEKVMESLNMLKYEKLYTVISMSKDKIVSKIMEHAAKKTDHFILTKHNVLNRAVLPADLSKEAEKFEKEFTIVEDVKRAVEKAMEMAGPNDLILITGSLFTVAEAREMWFPNKANFGREFNENINTQ